MKALQVLVILQLDGEKGIVPVDIFGHNIHNWEPKIDHFGQAEIVPHSPLRRAPQQIRRTNSTSASPTPYDGVYLVTIAGPTKYPFLVGNIRRRISQAQNWMMCLQQS